MAPLLLPLPPLRRRFVTVDGRRVHYLRTGHGPPAVFVHSSPTNAWYVAPQMRQLADRCTCFAFDTPGFGSSDALPGSELTVADLAQALADNMAAVELPPCPVYGTHTGAAIALSLAAHHPERATALVLDGVPIFSPAELADLFDGYFEPLVPDALGGHYAQAWTRFRDQYTWFPWTRKTPDRHNEIDLGSASAVHAWLMSFFQAGRTYKPAYRAATWYGEQALADARALRCPAVFTAVQRDMLYPHLDRLPPLAPTQQIRRVGNDDRRRDALIGEQFDRWPSQGAAPVDRFRLASGDGVREQFVDLPGGQVLLRHAGALDAPPLLLLHDAPGAGQRLAGAGRLLMRLAESHLVLMPDLPGCGASDALPAAMLETSAASASASATASELDESAAATPRSTPSAGPPLAAFADAVAAVCKAAGVSLAAVYGIGIGATLALVLAERHPALARAVVLRGLALPQPAERVELRQRYAPLIVPQADGGHWYRTWLMLRDQQIWFPWFAPRAANLRRVDSDFGAEHLHDLTFEVMQQHAAYHQVIEAAFAHDAAASLACLQAWRVPLALCHDPQVPLFAHDARLRAACPGATALPAQAQLHAAAVAAFFADAGVAPAVAAPVAPASASASALPARHQPASAGAEPEPPASDGASQ